MQLRSRRTLSEIEEINDRQSTPKKPKINKKNSNAASPAFKQEILVTPSKQLSAKQTNTPRTPSSVIQQSKGLFRRTCTPTRLIGRETERSQLLNFIKDCLINGASSLYVCGTPGNYDNNFKEPENPP